MSMKEIDNENAMKANATRDNVNTMHTKQIHTNKSIEHDSSKLTTTSMREKGLGKYAKAQKIMCTFNIQCVQHTDA